MHYDLLHTILLDAYQQNASDVHLEQDQFQFHVRYRVDRQLEN